MTVTPPVKPVLLAAAVIAALMSAWSWACNDAAVAKLPAVTSTCTLRLLAAPESSMTSKLTEPATMFNARPW